MELLLSLLTLEDAESLYSFEKNNKDFFEKHVPPRPDSYFEPEGFQCILDELLAEQEERKSFFYLVKNYNGELIGRMNLVDVDWYKGTGDIGYRVGEEFGRKGFAAHALKLLCNEAAQLELKKLTAKTTLNNIASQKVLETCHFKKTGIDEQNFIHYVKTL
ncbi:GNAT family N-acetyltransferase [Mesobacillus subterraneus]|uniref:N-acetyltransferase n=1 Tax=Mesobacillus subterraneus TaxID=285983 RepID=A0A427TM70_9BACI|nr:GNAT family N-acetyltransferase [Mesobacillus subterraneus]RSD25454.1 N-acetyltransferase [Mesobacillus subterraneus]